MFRSRYVSKPVIQGLTTYSATENATWAELTKRLHAVLPGRAAPEVLRGLIRLELPRDEVPQVRDVNLRLADYTGFQLQPVPAMIEGGQFFELLASRRFPVATFIRAPEELEYVAEPDVFHEIFGHAPLLTDPDYAEAVVAFGRAGVALGPTYYEALQRLFWFTVEFGLVRSFEGPRILGAGITSSARETVSSLAGPAVLHPFDARVAVNTPYEIDRPQPLYFVLDQLADLYDLAARLPRDLRGWCKDGIALV